MTPETRAAAAQASAGGAGAAVEVGLRAEALRDAVGLLRSDLADVFVLYVKARNYHWNVTGPQFAGLHALFEQQYTALNKDVDDIAERIRALGGAAPGTLAEFLDLTRLEERRSGQMPWEAMVRDLMEGYEAVARSLREDIGRCQELGDEGTANLLADRLEAYEKAAWMLRAHLGGPGQPG